MQIHYQPTILMFLHWYDVRAGYFKRHFVVTLLVSTGQTRVERGSSVVVRRTRSEVSAGSNPPLLPLRIFCISVLFIDTPVDSAV